MIAENLPPNILLALPQLGLILIGVLVEKNYTSRLTTFANSLALYAHVATLTTASFWLGTYADIGLILGIIGLIAYIYNESLNGHYYTTAYLLYSGLPVGMVIIADEYWFLSLVMASLFSLAAALIIDSDIKLAYTEALPGTVYEYAKNTTIKHTNYQLGYTVDINLLDAITK